MTRQLITSWSDYRAAFDRLLAGTVSTLRIYDEDLAALQLEDSQRLGELSRILASGGGASLQIAVRNALPLQRNHPRLFGLLARYGHIAATQQTSEQLAHLRDSMVLADARHALIRFDREQARGVLLLDSPEECSPYWRRFQKIWEEGGYPIAFTTLGL